MILCCVIIAEHMDIYSLIFIAEHMQIYSLKVLSESKVT